LKLSPSASAIAAIWASRGADLARLTEPHFDVFIYAFVKLRCALRRHHPRSAPIANGNECTENPKFASSSSTICPNWDMGLS